MCLYDSINYNNIYYITKLYVDYILVIFSCQVLLWLSLRFSQTFVKAFHFYKYSELLGNRQVS